MTNVELYLATLRFQRIERRDRHRGALLDDLRRHRIAPDAPQCCPPPCCFCCWEAL